MPDIVNIQKFLTEQGYRRIGQRRLGNIPDLKNVRQPIEYRYSANYGVRVSKMEEQTYQAYKQGMIEKYGQGVESVIEQARKIKNVSQSVNVRNYQEEALKKLKDETTIFNVESTAYDTISAPKKFSKITGQPKKKPGRKKKPGPKPKKQTSFDKELEDLGKKALKKIKEDKEAPYGRKKDGTPKQKPGRKTDKERLIRKAVNDIQEQIDQEKFDEDLDKLVEKTLEKLKQDPKNEPLVDDDLKNKIKEEYKKLKKEVDKISDEVVEIAEDLQPDKKIDLEELIQTYDEIKNPKYGVIPIPDFPHEDTDEFDPDLAALKAIGKRANKAKIGLENWFRCARIEFGRNISRLPVLLDLATRVANIDPSLLFKDRTTIDYWYHIFGWQRCDELITNLENISGLSADDSIKGYESTEERNLKIRRWYANRLRHQVRADLREQGYTTGPELEKLVYKRMRELGYDY